MAVLKFEGFVFDTSNHRLRHNGKLLSLRPKAIKLLMLLISNRTRVVSKSEIFISLWGSEFVRDHLLFQLISELRKAPFKADFIRTQPNLGYQWNVHTTEVRAAATFKSSKIAASILMCVLAVAGLYFGAQSTRVGADLVTTQLPAHTAFSKGVLQMHSGDHGNAEKWFKFALNENPDSVETSLFLAETLFLQDKLNESSAILLPLLKSEGLTAYSEMAVSDLLSRVYQHQGKLRDAMQYARDSRPDPKIAQCSTEVVNDRLASLEMSLAEPSAYARMLKPEGSTDYVVRFDETKKQAENYSQDCRQVERKPMGGVGCVPEIYYDLYVRLDKNKYFYS